MAYQWQRPAPQAFRPWSRGIAVVFAVSLFVLVPTTALDPDNPARDVVPIAAVLVLLAAWFTRRDTLARVDLALLAALLVCWGLFIDPEIRAEVTGMAVRIALLVAVVLVAGTTNASERLLVARSVVVLAMVQLLIVPVELLLLPEPLYGSPAAIGSFGEVLPELVPANALFGDAISRAQGTLGHPLPLALLAWSGMVLVLVNAVKRPIHERAVAFGVLAAVLVFSGSRSAILGAFAVTIVVVGARWRQRRPSISPFAFKTALAALVCAGLVVIGTAHSQVAALLDSGSWTHRVGAFGSIESLLNRPWREVLVGGGFGSSSDYYERGMLQTDGLRAVDNMYVLLLAEAGLLGVASVLLLFAWALLRGDLLNRSLVVVVAGMSIVLDTLAWQSSMIVFAVAVAFGQHSRTLTAKGPMEASGPAADLDPRKRATVNGGALDVPGLPARSPEAH
ncbi:hypothetical protein LRP67_03535 [Nocardioides sp. cx-169]|uniref:O-antigen ligase family protein n=1 Tax=Nocardioides sp. cx-169 TaxID=2899080 RepID=UPI001E5E1537|nr:O-antigen ligase family protein [Nocardioides sp. cx-169]MCD4533150.1 hypothetical protein [Nocardioides sp. cx-169]